MKLLGVCATAGNGRVITVGELIASTLLKNILAVRSAHSYSMLCGVAGVVTTFIVLILMPGMTHASAVLSVREVVDKSLSSASALKDYRAS